MKGSQVFQVSWWVVSAWIIYSMEETYGASHLLDLISMIPYYWQASLSPIDLTSALYTVRFIFMLRCNFRFRMSDPISAVYSFVKWGIASGATALSRDENCRTDLLAEDNIHAELISRGFSLVQALGLPQPLPCNSRAPLGDLGISQNEKLIATMSCV